MGFENKYHLIFAAITYHSIQGIILNYACKNIMLVDIALTSLKQERQDINTILKITEN
jgi:hypothetical protein